MNTLTDFFPGLNKEKFTTVFAKLKARNNNKFNNLSQRNSFWFSDDVENRLYPNNIKSIKSKFNRWFDNHLRLRMNIQRIDRNCSIKDSSETKY